MVDGQVRTAGVTDPAVIEAMLSVPRELFVSETDRAIAYLDLQLDVAPGRRLMTPMTVGRLLQAAGLDAGRSVLIIGCATGYTAALAAHIGADVVATESDVELAAKARANLGRAGITGAIIAEAQPLAGFAGRAPFDVILLDGATQREPTALYDQLRVDGALVAVFALGGQPRRERSPVRPSELDTVPCSMPPRRCFLVSNKYRASSSEHKFDPSRRLLLVP